MPTCRSYASTVFFKSIAIVMGPTAGHRRDRPGPARQAGGLKSTSPTRRYLQCVQTNFCCIWHCNTPPHPAFLDASGTLLMPTSMTVAPGFSHSPLTKPALPIANDRCPPARGGEPVVMTQWGRGQRGPSSPALTSRTIEAISPVREWQTVTVAFSPRRRCATGMPTMFERPMTTARFPSMRMS